MGSDAIRIAALLDAAGFLSTLPVWGATVRSATPSRGPQSFYPRSPCGERQGRRRASGLRTPVSIHAPRVGSDCRSRTKTAWNWRFYPRSPCGERRLETPSVPVVVLFLSTLPVWGATREPSTGAYDVGVSIHAPRVGSDDRSTRTPSSTGRFLSTLPVWGATRLTRLHVDHCHGFYPRSPCGERPPVAVIAPESAWFLSTLPVWGATQHDNLHHQRWRFLSTLPVWGATFACVLLPAAYLVSIHAPRVGSDGPAEYDRRGDEGFYPRSPCGERRRDDTRMDCAVLVSIHAPRVGSDDPFPSRSQRQRRFYPRSPCGERRNIVFAPASGNAFLSTLPVWGATVADLSTIGSAKGFYPRSPCGERRCY